MEADSTDNVDIVEYPIEIHAVNFDNSSSEERLIALSGTVEPPQVVLGQPEAGIGWEPGDPVTHFWHLQCYYLQDFRSHRFQLPPCRYPDLYNVTCTHPECPVTQSWEDDEHFGPNHGHFCELYTTDGVLVIVHFSDPYPDSISSGDVSFHSAVSLDSEPVHSAASPHLEPVHVAASSDPEPVHFAASSDPEPTRCSRCNGSGHEPEPLPTPNSEHENSEDLSVHDRVVLRRSSRIRAMQTRF